MANDNIATAEAPAAAPANDQYLAATHQYFHHCKQQQQQQRCTLHIPLPQQQQQHQPQPQQQQQPKPQQYHHNNNNNVSNNTNSNSVSMPSYGSANMATPLPLAPNASVEFDDFYWPQSGKQPSNCNSLHAVSLTVAESASGAGGGGGKTFITPGDIPPPPPHPPNINGRKRFLSAGRQRSRCHCEHPIEIVQQQQQHPPPHANHNAAHQHLPPQQQQQQQQQRPHNYNCPHNDHNHLPPPPPLPREHHTLANASLPPPPQPQLQHQHQPLSYYKSHHHHRMLDDPPPGSYMSSTSSTKGVDARSMKNLVYSQMKIRKLRIILGVILGLVLLALLSLALYFVLRASEADSAPSEVVREGIHLDDVISGQLQARRFNSSWSMGTGLIYKENNSIVEYDVKAKRKKTLMFDEHQQYVLFEKSADEQLLLLAKHYKKNFRHSFEAEYDIYNISSGQIQPLTIKGSQRFVIMAQWAPVGHGLIINFERNLYYKPTAFADEIAITSDENPGILNGIPDWVYEEEVFSSNVATWFNPNGTMIAFIKFDDTPTHVINFPYYGEAGDLRYQYPYNRLVAYPKAGSSNPRVSLFTADLVRATQGADFLTGIPVPSSLNTETDYIITVVDWLDKDKVLSVWMNRIQNLAYLQVFDGVKRYEIYNMESKTGWVDLFSTPFKNRDGTRIALILPQLQSDQAYYRHLCTLSTKASHGNPEALTKGKYVVQSILHWDKSSDIIFYTANTEQNAEIMHVYAVKAEPGQNAMCLTCKLHISGDVTQTYYSADFNTDRQVVISSQGPGIPMTIIYEWSHANNQITLTKLIDWETNEALRVKLKNTALPTMEIHTFSLPDNFTAKVLLQLPPNLDRSGNTKYPMLVDVYGGPDSYSAVDKWIMDWGTYLTSNQSVIYAKIDGRGSGLRGDKLLHSVYLKLGTVEISDQISVARQLQQTFNFIDANHTGIWGWSYGGYAAAMALANDDSLAFKCAASVAPVTDWAYYDSIYTERYMSLPKLNGIGYSSSRLSTRAEKLRGKKFLLIHGTLDDNVHYQQSMILAKNLERHDILFKQISYPDEDHSLASVRPHLYHSLDRFFGECFASKRMMRSSRK